MLPFAVLNPATSCVSSDLPKISWTRLSALGPASLLKASHSASTFCSLALAFAVSSLVWARLTALSASLRLRIKLFCLAISSSAVGSNAADSFLSPTSVVSAAVPAPPTSAAVDAAVPSVAPGTTLDSPAPGTPCSLSPVSSPLPSSLTLSSAASLIIFIALSVAASSCSSVNVCPVASKSLRSISFVSSRVGAVGAARDGKAPIVPAVKPPISASRAAEPATPANVSTSKPWRCKAKLDASCSWAAWAPSIGASAIAASPTRRAKPFLPISSAVSPAIFLPTNDSTPNLAAAAPRPAPAAMSKKFSPK